VRLLRRQIDRLVPFCCCEKVPTGLLCGRAHELISGGSDSDSAVTRCGDFGDESGRFGDVGVGGIIILDVVPFRVFDLVCA